MAQQGGRRKKAPAYSADTMALRYIAGLALAALGVMIFMAVDLNMSGNIFQGLRQVCFGISGSLAYILAVLPLWAGGLVIWSAQRRAPVRPWVFALLSFIGICTFIMLISGNALDSLDRRSGGQFGNVLQNVYSDCMRTGTGGGVLGTLLGWPLWRFLGTILGVIIIFLGTLFCLLMAVNLTPSRLRDIFTGQYSAHREQQKQERMYAEQQQMAWQQQQYAQQQAWQQHLMEQQQQQQYAQQQNMQQPAAPQYPPQNMPQGMQAGQQSVAQWQDQMTAAQTAAAAPGHQSSIFGGRNTAQPEKSARNWKSRIFGKKEEEYDGLVGDDTVPAEPVQPPRKTTGRRTATGAEAAPVTEWNLPDREAEAARKRQAAQPAVTEPAEEAPEAKIPKSVNRDSYKRPADRRPVREEVEEPAEEERPARRRPAAAPEAPAQKVKAPAVQQEMSRETWSPELNLKPSEKAPNTPEESEWIPRAYNYPPITDLAMPKPSVGDTGAEDAMRSRKLEETLASFRVQAQVVHVTHGPAVSRFELELAPGTKVNKVAELEKDIAYGMEATSVRIEAPIPGKSLVGVEVPNRQIETVTLREVLSSERMQNAKSILTVALGKDLTGTPIICDLAKMPHMLIAGQTGSGKSVCINAIINSLLYRASPDADPGGERPAQGGGRAGLGGGGDEGTVRPVRRAQGEERGRLQCLPEILREADGPDRDHHRRTGGPDDGLQEGCRRIYLPADAAGPGGGYPPDRRDPAAFRGRHHRPDQGKYPEPDRLQNGAVRRQPDDPGPERQRTAAGLGRYAVPAYGRLCPDAGAGLLPER